MSVIRRIATRGIKRACAGPLLRKTLCWNVACREPLVAVTFDDGPNAHTTPVVLDILAAFGAPATFFLQGDQVVQHPNALRGIVAAGHEIGNHSHGHSRHNLPEQVRRCDRALRQQGIATRLFRPPGGAFGARDLLWLARSGYTTVMWSLDAVDSMREEGKWRGEAPDYSAVGPGDIVLMHDDNAACIRDLPVLLETLKCKGLQPVVVSRLIGLRATATGGG